MVDPSSENWLAPVLEPRSFVPRFRDRLRDFTRSRPTPFNSDLIVGGRSGQKKDAKICNNEQKCTS